MPVKRVRAEVDGREIVAENTWFSGERLYVDGEVVASSHRLISVSETEPLLTAIVDGRSGTSLHIEVFIVAWATTRIMICVNGKRVAGARMQRQEEAAAERMRARLLEETAVSAGGAPIAVPLVGRDQGRS